MTRTPLWPSRAALVLFLIALVPLAINLLLVPLGRADLIRMPFLRAAAVVFVVGPAALWLAVAERGRLVGHPAWKWATLAFVPSVVLALLVSYGSSTFGLRGIAWNVLQGLAFAVTGVGVALALGLVLVARGHDWRPVRGWLAAVVGAHALLMPLVLLGTQVRPSPDGFALVPLANALPEMALLVAALRVHAELGGPFRVPGLVAAGAAAAGALLVAVSYTRMWTFYTGGMLEPPAFVGVGWSAGLALRVAELLVAALLIMEPPGLAVADRDVSPAGGGA